MKYTQLLAWTNNKLEGLQKDLSDECMICDFVNDGDKTSANQIWNKKWSSGLQKKKSDFRKRYKTYINQWNINKRLTQMTTLFVSYRTILVDAESTQNEKTEAQTKLIHLNRLKNLYYTHIQYYISNMNVKTKLGQDYMQIILFAFVPASFITGYYGMNFTSMGNLGKNYNPNGLLVSKYGHYYAILIVLLFCVASYFFVSNDFFNKDAGTINTVKRFNDLINMPIQDDYLFNKYADF
tara:strand:+ start:1408 stop:2121 length:714 start_codon:yes stop_codon:yes gene_type:complete